ncbi:unnamed protein product, partial [Symbiodinium microadriaticum]
VGRQGDRAGAGDHDCVHGGDLEGQGKTEQEASQDRGCDGALRRRVPLGDCRPAGEAGARREPGRAADGQHLGLYPRGGGGSLHGDGGPEYERRPSARSRAGGSGVPAAPGDRAGDPLQEQPLPWATAAENYRT